MTLHTHIHPALADAIAAHGYKSLTPVQMAVTELGLENNDLLVSAQTGSGKTVAFGLALAPTLLGDDLTLSRTESPLAIIIAPTRELALQVKRELEWLYRPAGAQLATCVGGMDVRDERRALAKGPHMVVGTPGRLCDHIRRGSLVLDDARAIVLDEADEMLKMGFREELEIILGAAPQDHRSLMFSATVPESITRLTRKYQSDAVRIKTVSEAQQHSDITYRALLVNKQDQENAIVNLLQFYDAKNAIVFGDTRMAVNRMTRRLTNRGFSVVTLSGEFSQKERSSALQALRDGRARVCVATDVAARGLDLPDLELVIHASIPKNHEALLHRSGRTGRAGRKGVSALIVTHNQRRKAERVLRDANVTAEWGTAPSADDVVARDNERLLQSLVLEGPVTDEERDIVVQILKRSTPETIATLFLRRFRADRAAPEELLDVPDFDPNTPRKGRAGGRGARGPGDFENGVWLSLNLGRKQKAEPRWILPMLCKSGGLKKHEIGAIKITETRSFIEISANSVERFVEKIGPEGKIEKAITAALLDGPPDLSTPNNAGFNGRDTSEGRKKKRSSKKKSGGNSHKEPRKDHAGDKGFNPDKLSKKEKAKWAAAQPGSGSKVYDAEPQKRGPDGKKPHKKKLAAAAKRKAKNQAQPSGGKPSNGLKLKRKKRR